MKFKTCCLYKHQRTGFEYLSKTEVLEVQKADSEAAVEGRVHPSELPEGADMLCPTKHLDFGVSPPHHTTDARSGIGKGSNVRVMNVVVVSTWCWSREAVAVDIGRPRGDEVHS
jgi:hypothetical protein